jgi:hypothetical protein
MFLLINKKTNQIAYVGKTPTECKTYAIRKNLFRVERTASFKHIICGDWAIEKASF